MSRTTSRTRTAPALNTTAYCSRKTYRSTCSTPAELVLWQRFEVEHSLVLNHLEVKHHLELQELLAEQSSYLPQPLKIKEKKMRNKCEENI